MAISISSGWFSWNVEDKEDFEEFKSYKPSFGPLFSKKYGRIHWIYCWNPEVCSHIFGDWRRAIEELKNKSYESPKHLEDRIKSLAKKHDVLNGKWYVHGRGEFFDDFWLSVVNEVVKGNLSTAKVSTFDEKTAGVICIYNGNFQDKKEIKRILKLIRSLGVKQQIYYKPDIYTYAKIYSGDVRGIKPYIYLSRKDSNEIEEVFATSEPYKNKIKIFNSVD